MRPSGPLTVILLWYKEELTQARHLGNQYKESLHWLTYIKLKVLSILKKLLHILKHRSQQIKYELGENDKREHEMTV